MDESDLVYRLGGDEFVVILPEVLDSNSDFEETVFSNAEKLLKAMDSQVIASGEIRKLGLSIGIAFFPKHARSVDELMSCADRAMYKAKACQSVVVFETEMRDEIESKRQLRENLADAIANEEFSLRYQPQVEIATNKIVGVEALIRWEKDGETISPVEFIPCLEETGRIIDVGLWVIKEACQQIRQWHEIGFHVRVSVNVISIQIQEDGFADAVIGILNEFGVSAELLDIEITESLLLENVDHSNRNIEKLASEGVCFSIDDFGTGYSSLAYLKQLSMDRIKIDRSFIKDIPDSDDGWIAKTVEQLSIVVF